MILKGEYIHVSVLQDLLMRLTNKVVSCSTSDGTLTTTLKLYQHDVPTQHNTRTTPWLHVLLPLFVPLVADGVWWAVTHSGRFNTGKERRCAQNRRLGGLPNKFGLFGENVNLLPLSEIEPPDRPVLSPVITLMTLSQLTIAIIMRSRKERRSKLVYLTAPASSA